MKKEFLELISVLNENKQTEFKAIYNCLNFTQRLELIAILRTELNVKPKETKLTHLLKYT